MSVRTVVHHLWSVQAFCISLRTCKKDTGMREFYVVTASPFVNAALHTARNAQLERPFYPERVGDAAQVDPYRLDDIRSVEYRGECLVDIEEPDVRPASTPTSAFNKFMVGVGPGDNITFMKPLPQRMSFGDALNLAAWIAVLASTDDTTFDLLRGQVEQL